MKFHFLILLQLVIVKSSLSQISTTKVTEPPKQVTTPYDSVLNYMGKDVYAYIGQDLYLKGVNIDLQKYGYDGFSLDYTKDQYDKANVYKCCVNSNSLYEGIVGKYFKVTNIFKHPKTELLPSLYGKYYYLQLVEKQSGDTVYFEYDSEYEHTFPFLVVGYYTKLQKVFIGLDFVFKDELLKDELDITTAMPITTTTGEKWKCIELTIEEKHYNLSLIVENTKGEKVFISVESLIGKYSSGNGFPLKEANNYAKKFGADNWKTILQGKVRIGMTAEMCRISWGEPKDINQTITGKTKSEQWVYSENYLYFTNGVLTTIQ